MICINVSRKFAAKEATEELLHRLALGPWAWIFIGEPVDGIKAPPDAAFSFNPDIVFLPTLEVRFWDITKPCSTHILVGEHFEEYKLDPIKPFQAELIVNFLEEYQDHNLVISCFAGKCRSGAVCQFAEKYYNYTWIEGFKAKADPNEKVYNELVKQWRI